MRDLTTPQPLPDTMLGRGAILWVLLFSGIAGAQEFGPWDLPAAAAVAPSATQTRGAPVAAPKTRESSLPASPFWLSFKFYQQVVSPIDGATCIHRPTCSLYALQAMHKHPMLGPFFALDRLWRGADSSSIRLLEEGVTREGYPYFKDPLELSDFWLR